jgi:hypothetical protein
VPANRGVVQLVERRVLIPGLAAVRVRPPLQGELNEEIRFRTV